MPPSSARKRHARIVTNGNLRLRFIGRESEEVSQLVYLGVRTVIRVGKSHIEFDPNKRTKAARFKSVGTNWEWYASVDLPNVEGASGKWGQKQERQRPETIFSNPVGNAQDASNAVHCQPTDVHAWGTRPKQTTDRYESRRTFRRTHVARLAAYRGPASARPSPGIRPARLFRSHRHCVPDDCEHS